MKHFPSLFLLLFTLSAQSQNLYFPPISGSEWETLDPADLGWCPDSLNALIDYVGDNNSKAFIILKGGKIVVEQYYDNFTADSLWYWASAGKTMTAFLIGMAQQQGLLDIDDPTNQYLGDGWTSCTQEQENAITIRNQLSMTTGLEDGLGNLDCTLDTCLQYLAPPGTRWSYHNAPYTLLDGVLENATNSSINQFLLNNVSLRTGIFGLYVQLQYNNVFFSTARRFARFGLLTQNKGVWNQDSLMTDQQYFNEMTTPSQEINKSYGYLWWLNGYESYMLPQLQFVFPGYTLPDAPADLYAGIGKDGQYVMVSPSEDMVVVRMGNEPEGLEGLVPTVLGNNIWQKIGNLICGQVSIKESIAAPNPVTAYPNPGSGLIRFSGLPSTAKRYEVFDHTGRLVYYEQTNSDFINLDLESGLYSIKISTPNQSFFIRYINN